MGKRKKSLTREKSRLDHKKDWHHVARKAWTHINQAHSQLSPVFINTFHIFLRRCTSFFFRNKTKSIPFQWNEIEPFHLISNTSSSGHQLKEVLAPILEMGFLLVVWSSLESNVTCLVTRGLEAVLTGASSSSWDS